MAKYPWHHLKEEEVFRILKSSREGLSWEEARRRLARSGRNQLPRAKRATWFFLLLSQFRSVLIYILLIAALISFLLKDQVDTYVILAAVVINVMVGFVQELKATKALENLSKVITPRSLVLRDGHEFEIEVEKIVPGDILFLRAGDKVPADARLVHAVDLEVNEATLTGEAYPMLKKVRALEKKLSLASRKNMVYQGTLMVAGTGLAVVVATGLETELGRIATLVKETKEEETPLQLKLRKFSTRLGFSILLVSLSIFTMGFLAGYRFIEVFTTSVAVAVSAIPEGLMVAVTVILVIGMQRILKRKALTRKLLAVETLGSTTVICADKTGTLTQGEMRAVRIIFDHKEIDLTKPRRLAPEDKKKKSSLDLILKIAALSNDAHIKNDEMEVKDWVVVGNPTEKALALMAGQFGYFKKDLKKEEPRLSEIPFGSERKYMVTLHRFSKEGHRLYFKGAPEIILGMSKSAYLNGEIKNLSPERRAGLRRKYENLSNQGFRILALAYKEAAASANDLKEIGDLTANLIFVGLLVINDPLREGVKETISLCKKAGIKIVMITGDHRLTAKAVAEEIGLPTGRENILEGTDLDNLSDDELKKRVRKISVYARVAPRDKLRIIDAWQAAGEVVAMTGDGVNDAPALKAADIGVALGSGSEVARETANLVLLNNNVGTIVAAVNEGRVIYENVKKVILYLLSDSLAEILIIASGFIFGLPLPLLASQILWVNIIDDSSPAMALAFEPGEREIMNEPPVKKGSPIFDLEAKILVLIISLVSALGVFLSFYFLLQATGDLTRARTVAFAILGLSSLFYVFSCRNPRHSIFKINPFRNPWLVLAVAFGIILQLIAVYLPGLQRVFKTAPLGGFDWPIIVAAILAIIISIEITKSIFILKKKNEKIRS